MPKRANKSSAMGHCYSVLIGARNGPGHGKFSKRRAQIVCDITARYFPEGSSILDAEGGWFDPERRIFVREESRQVLVCASSLKALRPWCAALSRALQQRELLVVRLGPATLYRPR